LYRRIHEHFNTHHLSLLESIIRDEEDAEVRVIEKQGEFSAFCPYASSYPFEVMIGSKKCISQMDTISDGDIDELALILMSVLKRLNSQLKNFSFNLWISTPPLGENAQECEAHRLFIRITPRLYRFGGFEVNSEMMINPVEPELAAKFLRGDDHG
jgi:UDPglucose--hexose-1-phosphate uridylyltransferase